jgi:alpha-glucosidase
MRFWLRRGVDGFRVDVIWHLIKDDQFRDNPLNPDFRPGQPPNHAVVPLYTADRPEVHDLIREMRVVMEEFPERLLIGEIYLPIERLMAYYGRDLQGVHLPFNFALLGAPWHARSIARLIDEYEAALPAGGWPNWVLGNHDRPRIASRAGIAQAPVAAMLLLTLRGTPTIYYGDELGMEQVAIAPDQVRDPFERNVPGLGLGRDGCRTPMPWDAGVNAGFSTAEPWLPLGPSHAARNVAILRDDAASIYTLYRKLIALRRARPSLRIGEYRSVAAEAELLLFVRQHGYERLLIALNMGGAPAQAVSAGPLAGRLLLSTLGDREGQKVSGTLDLRANEGAIIELTPESVLP